MGSFQGFGPNDFDAYLKNKHGSNAFNLERMKVKDKFTQLSQSLLPLFAGLNLDLELSCEYPSIWNNKCVDAQWLYFTRNKEEKQRLNLILERECRISDQIHDPSPLHRNILLFVKINSAGISLGLMIHPNAWVDFKNGLNKIKDKWERQKFFHLLGNLPAESQISYKGSVSLNASQITDYVNENLFEALDTPFVIQINYEKIWPKLHSDEILGEIAPVIKELIPVYQFLAWTSNNDFINIHQAIKEEKLTKKTKDVQLSKGDRIEILKGPFKGKSGILEEIDKRGYVAVLIQKRIVKLDGHDVRKI